MKFKITFILVIFSSCLLANNDNDRNMELFKMANAAYKNAAYDSAKVLYTEIANTGFQSTALFYNLGNTFYKTGNIPASILYFERALKLDPQDKDARYNLEVSTSFIADKIEPIESVFLSSWWNGLANSMSEKIWAWAFIVAMSIACIGISVYYLARYVQYKQFGFFLALFAILASGIILALGVQSKNNAERDYAIVFSPSVNVKSEPDLGATVQFVIHEGLKVEMIDRDQDWVRINLSDGNSGWVPAQSIELI